MQYYLFVWYFSALLPLVSPAVAIPALVIMKDIANQVQWQVVVMTTTLHTRAPSTKLIIKTRGITKEEGDHPFIPTTPTTPLPLPTTVTEGFIHLVRGMVDTMTDGHITLSHMTITWNPATVDTIRINDIAMDGDDDCWGILMVFFNQHVHSTHTHTHIHTHSLTVESLCTTIHCNLDPTVPFVS